MQSNSFAATKTNLPPVISFSIEGFWTHVTMNGEVGTDQHGYRWFYRNGKLYSEHTSRIIPVKPESPKKSAVASADELFMLQRASDRVISYAKYRQHEMSLRSYSADKIGRVTA